MAEKVTIKLNQDGIRELLRSEEMQQLVKKYADEVQERAGDGYESSVHVGPLRCRSQVKAVTHKAYRDNLKNNTLLKAVKK